MKTHQNTMQAQSESTQRKIDKVTLCFDVQSNIAMRLYQQSIETNRSTNFVINTILEDYFKSIDKDKFNISRKEQRSAVRLKVSIPAVMEIQLTDNETQYKPVNIVNISSGGVGIQMEGHSPRIIDRIRSNSHFILIFSIHTAHEIVCAICKPAHVVLKSTMEIGASFKSVPEDFNYSLCM